MTSTSVTTARSSINPWLVLIFMSIPIFVGALDLTVVSAFLPELVLELELPLQTGLDDAAWIVTAYFLAVAIGMIVMGRFSDLVGRRRVYIACLLIFVAGSVLVATAHTAPTDFVYSIYRRLGERPDRSYVNLLVIIIGRIIQAFGAGAIVPITLALVADLFPPDKRARPFGFIGAVDTLGWVLGHLYGGVLIQVMPWQGLFWINVPLVLFSLLIIFRVQRDIPQRHAEGRFDYLGALVIGASLICLVLGLGGNVEISTTATLDDISAAPPFVPTLLFASAVLLALFVFIESRVRYPIIHLTMFRNRGLSAGLITNLFVGYCLFIGLVIVPFLVNVRLEDQSGLREAALQVGLLLSTLTVPMALAAVPGGWLSERIGNRITTVIGLVMAMIGFLFIWQTWSIEISDAWVALQMAIVGIGIGLTFSPISASVINVVNEEERGVASTLVIILRLIGMTISVSSLTTIALQRVNFLVASELGQAALDPIQYADTYATITVRVLGEMGLIGAVLCGIALIPALMLKNDSTSA